MDPRPLASDSSNPAETDLDTPGSAQWLAKRERLALLIGRLLALHWLRERGYSSDVVDSPPTRSADAASPRTPAPRDPSLDC
jgi:hypothetical protein